jgi:hypothetical protein
MRLIAPQSKMFGFACWLVLAATFLRGLVPAGYMPDMEASRAGKLFAITICSGATGEATIYLPASQIPGMADDAQPKAPKGHGHDQVPCAFAASLALAKPEFDVSLPAASLVWRSVFAPRSFRLASSTYARAYFSQGPPTLSGPDIRETIS